MSELTVTDPVEITVRPKDKLFILVNAQDPKLTNMFNLPIMSQQLGMDNSGSSGTNRGVSGYTIDTDGYINFPVVGKVKVAGMTREQIADHLTIFGKREKVLVLRQENGKQRVYGVNLCSADHIYTSPVYYLQQNDVVYVEANDTKLRQSTVNGNTIRSASFWISLASLITSIAVLIVK